MTYIITINGQHHKVESRDQVIISDCRWYGYSAEDKQRPTVKVGFGLSCC